MLRQPLCVLAFLALAACSGSAAKPIPASVDVGPHSCPAFGGGTVNDPMTDPAAGATGVSPAIGHVTVPAVTGLAGLTIYLDPVSNGTSLPYAVQGGTFIAGAPGMLTATIPPLSAGQLYYAQASVIVGTGPLDCPLWEAFFLGSFTTQ